MLELAMSRLYAAEVFIYHVASYLIMIVFLAGAAKRIGKPVSFLAFIPIVQHYEFARVLALPPVVGVLLSLATLSLYTVDFFYGFVSMVRFADAFVLIPAYWYIWWYMTHKFNLNAWVFYLFFLPLVPFNVGYLVLGASWLLGKHPFETARGGAV